MANTCNGSYSGPNVARAVQEKLQRLDSVDTNIRAVAGAFAGDVYKRQTKVMAIKTLPEWARVQEACLDSIRFKCEFDRTERTS